MKNKTAAQETFPTEALAIEVRRSRPLRTHVQAGIAYKDQVVKRDVGDGGVGAGGDF